MGDSSNRPHLTVELVFDTGFFPLGMVEDALGVGPFALDPDAFFLGAGGGGTDRDVLLLDPVL